VASTTSIDTGTQGTETGSTAPGVRSAPVVIEVRHLEKTFRIPSHRVDSFKERAVHPFTRAEYRELHALRNVSFDVRRGEFFGIVGRNGSGKSTLLKILASIYKADAGTIRMAGRLAPFIELGVGFNPELSARENVVLNGVMMGLSQREARRRLDAVLEFAELEEFVDLKLMIDEVLAVGDAAFQQKCADVFQDMRDEGRTIVLVTHQMGAVQRHCHRAMLLQDGELLYIGDPEEAGRRYFRLNFAGAGDAGADGAVPDLHARLSDAWLENADGERVANVEVGQPIRLRAVVEARTDLLNPSFKFECSGKGVQVFGFTETLTLDADQPDRLEAGQKTEISGTIENRLAPGRYAIHCWVLRERNPGDLAAQPMKLLDFVVFGADETPGIVSVRADVSAIPGERGEG
jgi:ABC-type polysaccharide/polyol phosphate transport system ATPase subunit